MNNEEKILELLGTLTGKIDKQGEILTKHDKLLEKLTEEVDRQGEILTKHDKLLEKLTEGVDRQGEILTKHDKLLEKLTEKVDRQGETLEELDSRSLRSAVILENEVLPKLQLLYEGQVHLQETLAPKERVEILEDEVITLKTSIKMMMKRLDALEKAQ